MNYTIICLIITLLNTNFRKALTLSFHFGLRAVECAKLRYEDISAKGIKIIDSKGKRNSYF